MCPTLCLRPRRGLTKSASMTERKPQITDEQWLLIAELFAEDLPSPAGGRPRIPSRPCLEGIVWILRSGARWKDLPKDFPSPTTCWRRLNEWTKSGVFQKVWARLLRKLDGLGRVRWEEVIADGTFASAKKGDCVSARLNGAKARRSWSLSTERVCRSASTSSVPVRMRSL
jgi:transposase